MNRCPILPSLTPIPQKVCVVLPVCNRDGWLLAQNLDWQFELDGRKDAECVLTIDISTDGRLLSDIEMLAWRTFASVQSFPYPTPKNDKWPEAPNWAFQHTARYMQSLKRPWLWMEPDFIPVREKWHTTLSQTYQICRKPVMGSIVKGMGHCNGTAIYPANFPMLYPDAMKTVHVAWDDFLKYNHGATIYDASEIMCHAWGIERGKATQFGGEPAVFHCWGDVQRWVCPNAVTFHRCKNRSLIDRLREHHRKNESLHLLQPD